MSVKNFSVQCCVCKGEVDSFNQNIRFILLPDEVIQEREEIILSCGCVINFPDWQIDVSQGICRIYDFAGILYVEFLDVEVMMDEDEED
jgi:hypothetical protein